MTIRTSTFATALGLAAFLIVPVQAQQDSSNYRDTGDSRDNQSQQDQDRQRDRQEGSQQDRQRQDERQQQQQQRDRQQAQSQQGQRMQAHLDGWIKVAVDYNNDGRADAIETIYVLDFEKARQNSQARSMQDGQRRRAQQERQRNQNAQLTGTIQSLEHKQFMNSDTQKVVAKVKNSQGRMATVCLGSKEKVNQLDLQEGDRIRVQGVRARMNDRSMLLARRVESGDQSITNELPQQRQLKRFQGEIVSKRETQFQGRDGSFIVAEVRTRDHGTKRVNLGPASELEDVDLSEGTQVKMLAREGRMNNQPALIAQVIRVDGQNIDVREATRQSAQRLQDRPSSQR